MFSKKPIIYAAIAMTGENQEDVVERAESNKKFLENAGFEVLCPVNKEGLKKIKKQIKASKKDMDVFWPIDKDMIRKSNVFVNFSPNKPSLGVIREYGRARYYHWKKVISVFPSGQIPWDGALCHYEDDEVVDSLEEVVESILRTHGTYFKRLKWRLKMLNEHILHFTWDQITELFR